MSHSQEQPPYFVFRERRVSRVSALSGLRWWMAEAVRLANDSRVLFEVFGASDEERTSFARDFKASEGPF